MKIIEKFKKRHRILTPENIEDFNTLIEEKMKILSGEQQFSIGCLYQKENKENYALYFITGKFGQLEGSLLILEYDLTWQERFSLTNEYALFLYEKYSLDLPRKIHNTFELYQKSIFRELNYIKETNVIGSDFVENHKKYSIKKDNYIYLIKNNSNGLIKVGKSTQPYKRESTLQSQEPNLTIISIKKGSYQIETEIHRKYKAKRIRGEWFNLTREEINDIEKFIIHFNYI